MATYVGLSAAGKSIERLLNAAFAAEQPVQGSSAQALLVRTEELPKTGVSPPFATPALTLFVYRVDFNKTMRAAWSGVGHLDGRSHLPVDIHFLITAWSSNAEEEQRILGKAMECLETTPILAGPLLYPDPDVGWAASDAVQVVLEDLSTEAVMRTFDSLPADYKLSVPYIARVVRIDGRQPVVRPLVTSVARGLKPSVEP